MNRAYSVLEIKAFDEDRRTIEGIATTPAVDRVGDMVDPKGAAFKLPIPLLWQHDSHQPIGHVTSAAVTRNGIRIKAQLAKLDEAGTLSDRLDEAWQSIRTGLVRGLSIGFRDLARERIEDEDGRFTGYRFTEWEWLELSAVTIPANQDASITAVKRHGAPRSQPQGRAASGRRPASPGVTGQALSPATKGQVMDTIEQRLRALEDQRSEKAERMDEIKPADDGSFADDAAKAEFRGLVKEIREIDEKIGDIEGMLIASRSARPVSQRPSAQDGSRSRDPKAAAQPVKKEEPGIGFARYAMCLATARGNRFEALEVAKQRYPGLEPLHRLIKVHGEVAAGTTDGELWASPLISAENYTADFIEYLTPRTIVGRFGRDGIPSLMRVPFNIRVPSQTSQGTGYWVGEGKPKPATQMAFGQVTLGFSKVAAISVITDELARLSTPSAEMLVRASLASAIIATMDSTFVGTSAASAGTGAPAGLLVSGTPTQASGGDAAADVREDVKYLFGLFIAANNPLTSGVWIMHESTALALMLMRNELGQDEFPGITQRGGTFMGLPVITSNHVTSTVVILANAGDIYLADDGVVKLDISREATLAMSSDPAGDAGADDSPASIAGLGGASEGSDLVSLWQQNLIGLRAERWVRWQKRRTGAVAFLSSVTWGTPAS